MNKQDQGKQHILLTKKTHLFLLEKIVIAQEVPQQKITTSHQEPQALSNNT